MTYEDLEQALEDGKTVQVCSINHKGQAVEWFDVDVIKVIYDVSRFRIINRNDNETEVGK